MICYVLLCYFPIFALKAIYYTYRYVVEDVFWKKKRVKSCLVMHVTKYVNLVTVIFFLDSNGGNVQ